MKKNLEIIGNSPLFAGIALEDVEAVLKCLQAQIKEYEKNELLLQSGSQMKRFGMILHGSVLIQKPDFEGNTVILTQVTPGELFGEAFACW